MENRLFAALFLFCLFVQISSSTNVLTKYFKFSNQNELPLENATHFATLRSSGLLKSQMFIICGSIYIGYFRGYQAFYTVRKSIQKDLWFSLYVTHFDISEESYTTNFVYFGGSVLPNTGEKFRLQLHSWSHACTAIDMESGHVLVVINGVLTHNTTVISKDFTTNLPADLQDRLILGTAQWKLSSGSDFIRQSEASVTKVNIFSATMDLADMITTTRTGECREGDVVSWSEATWRFTGSVEEVTNGDLCRPSHFPHLYEIAGSFPSWTDCMALCPRLGAGGRVPLLRSPLDATNLAQIYHQQDSEDMVWASFRYTSQGSFTDYYTGIQVSTDLWVEGQPNGGLIQQCSGSERSLLAGRLFDVGCQSTSTQFHCLCQLEQPPLLRLRGLCKGSNIDTHFTLQSVNGSNVFMGLKGTLIRFLSKSYVAKWWLDINLMNTSASTPGEESSLALGKRMWSIQSDSGQCYGGQPHNRQLKLSGCSEGEFTCGNGDCVAMEARCDQALNCQDKTDEVNCTTVVLEESYRKTAPPVTLQRDRRDHQVIPAAVTVTFALLDVAAIRETENKIDLKFTTVLEWIESRATFHNLKQNSYQNTLETSDMLLWVPKLIYRNNKDNDNTRSELMNSNIMIIRMGNFTRSNLDVVDETEIFSGLENPIRMVQTYTKEFKCQYNLLVFPFDTQVRVFLLTVVAVDIFRHVTSAWQWQRQIQRVFD